MPAACPLADDANQILLLDAVAFADQLLGDAAILREHQEADRIDVEAAGGNEALQVLRQ